MIKKKKKGPPSPSLIRIRWLNRGSSNGTTDRDEQPLYLLFTGRQSDHAFFFHFRHDGQMHS